MLDDSCYLSVCSLFLKIEKTFLFLFLFIGVRVILDILVQCNRPKSASTCTSSLGFNRLYIFILWFIVTQIIILYSYIIFIIKM